MIYETINKIYQRYEPDVNIPDSKAGISHMLAKIENSDPKTAKLLRELKLSFESYQFVKQDIELRSKVKDIWIMQVERTKSEMLKCLLNFNNQAVSHKSEPLNSDDWL
jgi:hypothetical protein